MKKREWPAVGMRIIKSAIGVLLVFVIYVLRGKRGAPFYTALSVLWCMQPDAAETKIKAFQRTAGTLIGAVYGLILILIDYYILGGAYEYIRYLMFAAFVIPVIYTTLVLNKKNASYFACVVFLSISVMHINDSNPYIFVFNRVLDTMIGIGLAHVINTIHLPRKRHNDVLFVSHLDEVLEVNKRMSSYSKFELNRMLDHGVQFSLATSRPPASLIPELAGVRVKLPVITMDGAVLYDLKENRVLKKYHMEEGAAEEVVTFIKEKGFQCFINVIMEDSVVIYYDELLNEAEKDIYSRLRVSPYRNYVKATYPMPGEVVYLMMVDTKERREMLYEALVVHGYTKRHKVLKHEAIEYPGYMYLKIYHLEATKENMITHLKALTDMEEVITLGSMGQEKDEKYDTVVLCDQMVKNLKKAYERYFWQKEA